MKFIDLSVPLSAATPVYPGDPIPLVTPLNTLQKDGYQIHSITLATHVGTHIDAPSHMIDDGKTLNHFPLEAFQGEGVYVKVSGKFDLESIKQAPIKENSIVLFHTGMDMQYGKPAYFEKFPALSEEIAKYLISKKVKMVGVDMCSVDTPEFAVHKLLLKNNILILENLTNLSELQRKKFEVFAFPLKVHLDGSPVRVVAKVE